MPWPWVSRARFDDAINRLEKVEQERDRYLQKLIERQEPPRSVSVEEDRTGEQKHVTSGNPFDRIEQEFARSFSGGKTPDPKFKARLR